MRAFIAANPRLRPGMLGVTCQDGELQEVRICFSKDLREFQVARRSAARAAAHVRSLSRPCTESGAPSTLKRRCPKPAPPLRDAAQPMPRLQGFARCQDQAHHHGRGLYQEKAPRYLL